MNVVASGGLIVCWTQNQVVWVQALARVTALHLWTRQFTLTRISGHMFQFDLPILLSDSSTGKVSYSKLAIYSYAFKLTCRYSYPIECVVLGIIEAVKWSCNSKSLFMPTTGMFPPPPPLPALHHTCVFSSCSI